MKTIFGTDGIRGTVGEGFFTEQNLIQCGKALGIWLSGRHKQPQLLLAQDTRISAGFVKSALKIGLLQTGVTVYDAAVLPTPALFHLMRDSFYNAALMISASHNPYYDNGLKIITHAGKLSTAEEQEFSEIFNTSTLNSSSYSQDYYVTHAKELYLTALKNIFPQLTLKNLKIVIDASNGAMYQAAIQLLQELGATVIPYHVNPNGININANCGSLYPETMQQAVQEYKADLGCAFDGDGDRLILAAPDGTLKDGDDILALLTTHPDYTAISTIVGTTMSNEGFATWCSQNGKQLIRTPVGDKYVIEQLAAHSLSLGGEPSGHIILQNHVPTGDGLLVLLKVLETIIITKNYSLQTFTKYPQALTNIRVTHKKDLAITPCKEIIAAVEEKLTSGRVLVRYSGTENLLRVMVETDEATQAQSLCTLLATQLSTILQ